MSIVSYPERGEWGQSSWNGNASGYFYKDLFAWTTPKVFVDPMAGSMTSIEVAQELGIEAYGLDLHSGFNILRDSIVERVGKPADLVFSHPPYHAMHVYSGEVYQPAHPDDLSRCTSDEDFHVKLQLALLNQREATKPGGHFGILIGDWRRKGQYSSYQAEAIARMRSDELVCVAIKAQHNTRSGRKTYGKMMFPLIEHEYIIIWRRRAATLHQVLQLLGDQHRARGAGTWRSIVRLALMQLGGKAALSDIYDKVFDSAKGRIDTNPHWKEKVRQVLQTHQDFAPVERGIWQIA